MKRINTTGKSFDDSFLVSFGLGEEGTNKLTNAGVLIADDCPLRQSRLFCVRWNGLTKAGGLVDVIHRKSDSSACKWHEFHQTE